jgi:hypothetical protein
MAAMNRKKYWKPCKREAFKSLCKTLPNFIGEDSSSLAGDGKGDRVVPGPKKNKNEFRRGYRWKSSIQIPCVKSGGIIMLRP